MPSSSAASGAGGDVSHLPLSFPYRPCHPLRLFRQRSSGRGAEIWHWPLCERSSRTSPSIACLLLKTSGEVSPEHAEGNGSKRDFQCTQSWLLSGKPIARYFLKWGLCSQGKSPDLAYKRNLHMDNLKRSMKIADESWLMLWPCCPLQHPGVVVACTRARLHFKTTKLLSSGLYFWISICSVYLF